MKKSLDIGLTNNAVDFKIMFRELKTAIEKELGDLKEKIAQYKGGKL